MGREQPADSPITGADGEDLGLVSDWEPDGGPLRRVEVGDACELERFSRSRSIAERAAAARHPQAGPDLLVRLANDRSSDVAGAAIANPTAPPGLLAAMAVSPEGFKRASVAENPAIPADLAEALAGDDFAATRIDLARNPAFLLRCSPGWRPTPTSESATVSLGTRRVRPRRWSP